MIIIIFMMQNYTMSSNSEPLSNQQNNQDDNAPLWRYVMRENNQDDNAPLWRYVTREVKLGKEGGGGGGGGGMLLFNAIFFC